MRITRPIGVLLLALLFGFGVVAPASAHDFLVSSNPANGSTVSTSLSKVTLSFNDIVLSQPSRPQVEVVGPDGKHYETGCATSIDRDVSVPVALGPSGTYVVTWRIVSADGHPVSTSISFRYTGPASGSGAAEAPACQAASPSAASTPASSGDQPTAMIALVIGVLALAAGLIGWRVWSTRGQRTSGL
ncbi:hypothetical protein ATK17_2881 [Branchiibius hedensis]|uniref:CopC domain-containing protein n=1 Tax=Branchiibius hedensis TaxID=672460 RepID=A0A2Y8ZW75_9MICO|nr:copper resistance CopC family protein [Branchiibius hedensis]PWJ26707.1 hypothetical protein ATK17_2881 [Branchiibius hedensis]SSA35518.1 hypothetical protein SAMN04489750_2881 [Branchiibius hedensis]